MIRYISSYYFSSYYVSNCSHKVPVFPKFSTPQFFFNFRIFTKYYTGAYTLQHPNYSRYTISRWKRQKYMYMILCYLKSVYLKIMILCYLAKYLFYLRTYLPPQYPFPIFRDPYKMILRIIHSMACSFEFHTTIILTRIIHKKWQCIN